MPTMSGTCSGPHPVRFHHEPGAKISDSHDGCAVCLSYREHGRSGDLLLAREGIEGGRSFALLARIREGKELLTCRLKTWKHGLDIYSALEDELRHLL